MRKRSCWRIMMSFAIAAYATSSLLLASFATVTRLDPNEVTRIHCFPEDKVWRFSIFEADLAATPKWNSARTSQVPLALPKAIDLARRDLTLYVRDPRQWVLGQVELQQYRETGWWYYVVSFARDDAERNEAVSVPVLMNGTTIKGKPDPNYRPGGDEE